MGAVYNYCAGKGSLPRELEAAWMVEQYGAASVYGRVLGVGEMRRMTGAWRIWTAYMSRETYRNRDGNKAWAEWASKYPDEARLLNEAAKHG